MMNPFDDEESLYFALENNAGMYSIWPSFVEIPPGWSVVAGPALRAEILTVIDVESSQNEASATNTVVDATA